MKKRLHILVEGRVQGVGYRFTARDKAVILGLKGFVRNLEDGRVEIVAEGDEAKLKEMLQWCRSGPSMAHVLNVLVDWSDFEAEFHGFDID